MEASLERDPDKACRSLSEHLLRTRDKLLQIEPTIFGD
jgi:DNA-binding GntR family transcriptional regulator